MRGPRHLFGEDVIRDGITPAYAGTTIQCPKSFEMYTDHPRLCGDHRMCALVKSPAPGSPPLMRGPLQIYHGQQPGAGITPAYAGTTGSIGIRGWEQADHPRLCGDHIRKLTPDECLRGSPPLMPELDT